MSYDAAFRALYARRGTDEVATRRVQVYDEDGHAVRDDEGRRVYRTAPWQTRIRHNHIRGALKSARARAPRGMKVLYVQQTDPEEKNARKAEDLELELTP